MDWLNLLRAAVLGIVQGLTEFLPVSSTAHLLIGRDLLGYQDQGSLFVVMIQLGSILAVMWLYRARILEVIVGLPTKPEARRFALMLLLAFLPAIPIALLGEPFITGVLHESFQVIAWALILGGIAMMLIERFAPAHSIEDAAHTPIWRAIGVGFFQTLALIPGVSRSGATIFGGLILGLNRRAAAEFSFFLAMPTMIAAFVYDCMKVVRGFSGDVEAGGQAVTITPAFATEIAVGFVFAFISAVLVVKPFLEFVTRVGFAPFAWYRIAAGAALLAAVWQGWL